jgi:Domain of unknown function (DUF5666)
MKKYIALATIVAAVIATPAVVRAQDASTNTPAATTPAPKKHGAPAAHGKVSAVDATAMTITISGKAGDKTYTVTSDTKITKDKKPATLADIAVGDMVSIAAKKGEAGALNATAITVGGATKGGKKKSEAGASEGN